MTTEIKAYLGLGLFAIFVAAIVYFASHERGVEHKADVAADTKAVLVQAKHDNDIIKADQSIVIDEGKTYADAVATAVTGAAVVSLCSQPAPNPVHAPASTPAGRKPDAAAIERSADTPMPAVRREWDTSTVVQIGHDADAQIKGLQDYVKRVCPTL